MYFCSNSTTHDRFASKVKVICQLDLYSMGLKMSQHCQWDIHNGCLKQLVLSLFSELAPVSEASPLSRQTQEGWSVQQNVTGAISYTFRQNNIPHTPPLTSYINTWNLKKMISKLASIYFKARCKSLSVSQPHHAKTGSDWSLKRQEWRWPMQGCCSTSFIINSSAYWLSVHLEGKGRRADVWGSYISRRSSRLLFLIWPWLRQDAGYSDTTAEMHWFENGLNMTERTVQGESWKFHDIATGPELDSFKKPLFECVKHLCQS